MAHFAKIVNGVVHDVIVVANEDCGNVPFPESEPIGQAFIASLGIEGEWIQTSYNTQYVYDVVYDDSEPPKVISATIVGSEHTLGGTPFRGTHAGVGYTYDAATDKFLPPEITEIVTEAESGTPDGNA